MSVSVRDARRSEADRLWIESIYRDYLDDLAPLNTGMFPALGEVGHREPDQIARWLGDLTAYPLLILHGNERVGFAMVAHNPPSARPDAAEYRMAEFFIGREYRRLGIGRSAVQLIFSRFAGTWEIMEYLRNPAAVAFWRRVVAAYTHGQYRERIVNDEVRQWFDSRPGEAAR